MAALSELTCLGLHRPAPGAGASEMSAWFERLSGVHARLAQESRGEHAAVERQRAAEFARRAQSLNHHH
ncbi:hypothetical protein LY12_001278 [Prauserella alba]|nr:hypothetical protein [Prauserella alba]